MVTFTGFSNKNLLLLLIFLFLILTFGCEEKNDQEHYPRGADLAGGGDMGGIGGGSSNDEEGDQSCIDMVEMLYDCGDPIVIYGQGNISEEEARQLCIENPEAVNCPMLCYEACKEMGCSLFISCIATTCTDEEEEKE